MQISLCQRTNQLGKIRRRCDWLTEGLIHFQINQNRCQRYLITYQRAVTSSPSSPRRKLSTISSVTQSRATWGLTVQWVESQTLKLKVEKHKPSTVTSKKHTATQAAERCRQSPETRHCRLFSCLWRRAARKRVETHLTSRCLTRRRSSSHNWTN